MRQRFVPRYLLKVLVKHGFVLAASGLAGGFDETPRLFVLFRYVAFCAGHTCYFDLEGLTYTTSMSRTTATIMW
jgi:hypothetical protein